MFLKQRVLKPSNQSLKNCPTDFKCAAWLGWGEVSDSLISFFLIYTLLDSLGTYETSL